MNNYKALSAKDIADILVHLAQEGKKVLITGHRNPDGDCVGSAFALKSIYRELSGKAECIFPGKIPDYLSFLADNAQNTHNPDDFDTVITVDTASPTQMGDLSYLAERVLISIDHHESCTPYSDAYRVGSAAAAGELVFIIYEILKNSKKICENADICRLLYAAVSADTGSFMYSNTTDDTHSIAAKLIKVINADKIGDNTAEIARKLHNCKSLSALKAQKLCIEELQTSKNGKIAFIVLEKKKIAENSLRDEDLGSSVDIPRSIEGVLLAFVLKETDRVSENGEHEYKISSRSNCDISVADICEKFSGGGHRKAAGGSIFAKNPEIAVKEVLKAFESAVKALES